MNKLSTYLEQTISASALAVFRICFGLLMFISMVRFWAMGWIEKLYLQPDFSFSYSGFEFVQPIGNWTYVLFAVCGLSALGVTLGFRYRISVITFFLSFTYIELMDKTTYLNHYYFVSLVSFMMIFLPMHANFSWDARRSGSLGRVPKWTVDSLKVLITIVYFYAGLAKLNSDWLLLAMPLKIWLPSSDVPFLSSLFQYDWVIYAFAWAGAAYDLIIPFLLWNRKTRVFAFLLVVVFHVLTSLLFPIGMFPYIMILGTLVFFDDRVHQKILCPFHFLKSDELNRPRPISKFVPVLLGSFLVVQALLPFRHLAYPGELFWTEQGYRFSWRVMLMDKVGYAQFQITNKDGSRFYVDNTEFLTPFQEKQMATQPDFILEYAHYLSSCFTERGFDVKEVRVESYVALNGRGSQVYISPEENLLDHEPGLTDRSWVLPFKDDIKGL